MGPKSTKNQWKWDPKAMQNRWKIEVASQMRFWSVFGGQTTKKLIFWGPLFATIFGQKSEKTKKKINTVIGHCPGALQERKKNDFWEARKTSCFLDGFFIENGLLLEAIFNEKTIQKSMLILNPKKSWLLMKNQRKNCLSVCIVFYCFCSFSKSA